MSGSKVHKVRAVLGFNDRKVPALVEGTSNIHAKMSADPQGFPNPVPPMSTYVGLIDAVRAAQPAVQSRTKGASGVRLVAVKPLWSATGTLRSYVQSLSDLASPEEAAVIIVNAGMLVANVATKERAPITLTTGKPSGTVDALANKAFFIGDTAKSVTIHWQSSVDGGKTWISAMSTPLAHTSFTGLTPLTTLAVRVAFSVGKLPPTAWSEPKTILVL